MKKSQNSSASLKIVAVLALMIFLAQSGASADAPSKIKVKLAVPLKALPFPLEDVRLLDGPFKHAMELDHKYLLSLPPDRLLHNFRVNAGLPSSAKPLGGWEAPNVEVKGHFVGHYLSACARMIRSTGDAELKKNADAVVAGMAECQAKMGTGYLSAFPESFIDRVVSGTAVWAPWYTLHKIYAGLLDMYLMTDNEQALEVCKKACDWAIRRYDQLSDAQMQKMLNVEHGGMNEVLADLYAVTGEEKYLKLAQRFNHHAVLDPLARREDKLTGLHANTQFPKVIGIARQYELTGNQDLRTAAEFFWDVVTRERSYVIGGNSDGEYFSPKEKLSQFIGPNSTETCNTYNMLRLTKRLFGWNPKAEYADFHERSLYNHILASQNPETGMMCYYVPLKTGSAKNFGGPFDAFWCCTGTGVENHSRHNESIYFHGGESDLYVNLFIASELNWKDKGLKLRQETKYPEAASTRLTFTCEKSTELTLHIRHPWWAVKGVEIKINGAPQSIQSAPGSYITLKRLWKTGDVVEMSMPMTLRAEGFKDNPRKVALMYGPLVLCTETEPANDLAAILADEAHILDTIKPVEGKPLAFMGSGAVFRRSVEKPSSEITFIPFYQQYQKPYAVYWDVLTEAQWKEKETERAAELKRQEALQARILDRVKIGDAADERAHKLQGDKSGAGEALGRHWRHATDGGWFSYEMKTLPDKPVELLITYWGSDGGTREFDILVDGEKIATQKLENNKPGKFFDVTYRIPEKGTSGKNKVTVKLQALPGKWAGGIFDCATLK